MTSDLVSAGGDARRLLADVRDLARRVRLAQRVTWLPLLALGLVTLGAIPAYRFGHQVRSDCGPEGCKVFFQAAQFYWWAALALAYAAIAVGYARAARRRGLGSRVLPYVITGGVLVALSAAATGVLLLIDSPWYPGEPSTLVQFVLRLLDPAGIIGIALLVLAALERHVELLIFGLAYLAVVLQPITFGLDNAWGDRWIFAPQLLISGGVLLLGSAGFAVAQRIRDPR